MQNLAIHLNSWDEFLSAAFHRSTTRIYREPFGNKIYYSALNKSGAILIYEHSQTGAVRQSKIIFERDEMLKTFATSRSSNIVLINGRLAWGA